MQDVLPSSISWINKCVCFQLACKQQGMPLSANMPRGQIHISPKRKLRQFYELFRTRGVVSYPCGFNYKLHLLSQIFELVEGKGGEDDGNCGKGGRCVFCRLENLCRWKDLSRLTNFSRMRVDFFGLIWREQAFVKGFFLLSEHLTIINFRPLFSCQKHTVDTLTHKSA